MGRWKYRTSASGAEQLGEVARKIMHLCQCSEAEAVDRINGEYAPDVDVEGIVVRDGIDGLAKEISYGEYWWLSTPPLTIKPYPDPVVAWSEGIQLDWTLMPMVAPNHIGGSDIWSFRADSFSDSFLRLIVLELIRRFHLSSREAADRINERWRAQGSLRGDGTDGYFDQLVRELPGYWACDLYFGHGSQWWLKKEPPSRASTRPVTT